MEAECQSACNAGTAVCTSQNLSQSCGVIQSACMKSCNTVESDTAKKKINTLERKYALSIRIDIALASSTVAAISALAAAPIRRRFRGWLRIQDEPDLLRLEAAADDDDAEAAPGLLAFAREGGEGSDDPRPPGDDLRGPVFVWPEAAARTDARDSLEVGPPTLTV